MPPSRFVFTFVFEIVVDPPGFGIGGRKFRLAAQLERAGDGTIGSIDGGDVVATPIEREDALRNAVINDSIGVGSGVYCADGLQRLQVEDRHGIGAAVAREAAAQLGSQRDAVHALGVRNITHDGIGVNVHDLDVSPV